VDASTSIQQPRRGACDSSAGQRTDLTTQAARLRPFGDTHRASALDDILYDHHFVDIRPSCRSNIVSKQDILEDHTGAGLALMFFVEEDLFPLAWPVAAFERVAAATHGASGLQVSLLACTRCAAKRQAACRFQWSAVSVRGGAGVRHGCKWGWKRGRWYRKLE